MKTINQEAYDHIRLINRDPFGGQIIDFAERVAKDVEIRIASGERAKDIFESVLTAMNASEKLSDSQLGYVRQFLKRVWAWGVVIP